MIDIGFIGLGTMGRPMAGHLQAAGHRLFLHDVGPIAAELAAAGGVACESGREVAQKADAVIIIVPDTPHVEAVLFGAGGVAEGISKGKIVVDMSSIEVGGAPIDRSAPKLAAFPVTASYAGGVISAGHLAFLAVAAVDVNNLADGKRSGRWLLTEGSASGLHTLPVSLRRSAWDSSGAPLFGGEPVLCHALLRSCALRLSSEWSEQHCCESGDEQFVHMRSPSRKTHRSVIREAMERAGFHRGTRFFPKFPRSVRNWIGPRHNLAAPVMTIPASGTGTANPYRLLRRHRQIHWRRTMNKRLAISVLAASLLASSAAFAQSTTVEGARSGAQAGGEIGGPVGAMVGGTVGAAVGAGLEIPNAVLNGIPRERSVVVRERVVVGEPLPPTVELRPVPRYTEYRYAVVNDRRVIVEPRTRKIIKIID